jgi:phenylpropionate dioxygenase-like ring-hydroxylating dioxygenase large terminal subunit
MSEPIGSDHQVTGRHPGRSAFPRYDDAVLGLPGFWNPALFSRDLTRKRPVAVKVRGEEIVLVRDAAGHARALQDRCAHRGIPLSAGRQEFPGTLTCCYHGWTYDLASGEVVAALTDGPDSPVCANRTARVRTFPAVERSGLVWVYTDDDAPPPIDNQLPDELRRTDGLVLGRVIEVAGDWRHAVENGFDEGHAKYLHRRSWWKLFRYLPSWSRIEVEPSDDGKWLFRAVTDRRFQEHYPGLGQWPPDKRPWQREEGSGQGRAKAPPLVSAALPGVVRVQWREHPLGAFEFFELWVPAEVGRYRYLQLLTQDAHGYRRWRTRLLYDLAIRWVYHHKFHDDDLMVVRQMRTPPEVMYRPDRSIGAWRRMVEHHLAEREGEANG